MTSGLVLGIDTTSPFGSLALAEGGTVMEEVLLQSTDGFGHTLDHVRVSANGSRSSGYAYAAMRVDVSQVVAEPAT